MTIAVGPPVSLVQVILTQWQLLIKIYVNGERKLAYDEVKLEFFDTFKQTEMTVH